MQAILDCIQATSNILNSDYDFCLEILDADAPMGDHDLEPVQGSVLIKVIDTDNESDAYFAQIIPEAGDLVTLNVDTGDRVVSHRIVLAPYTLAGLIYAGH